jgi:hypothetical protein
MTEKAIRALNALKAQQHYSTLMLENEEAPVETKGVFVFGGSSARAPGNSGKGKSRLPRVLLREAQEEMERCEPFTTRIAKAILKDGQVTVETADEDWLRALLINS